MSIQTFTYDDPAKRPLTGTEPGVRMLHGEPYMFDGGAWGDWCARVAVMEAPADLTRMSDDEVRSLERHAARAIYDRSRDMASVSTAAAAVHRRTWAELSARGFRSDGTRAEAQTMARAA